MHDGVPANRDALMLDGGEYFPIEFPKLVTLKAAVAMDVE